MQSFYMQEKIKFSFIVVSADRQAYLERCISSIGIAHDKVKSPNIEILVIFNCAKSSNPSIDSKYRNLVNLYYVKETGLAWARNFGINQSKGNFLVFLDDDAAIKEDFLGVLSKSISIVGAKAFCGKIIDPIKNQFYSKCFSDSNCKFLNRLQFRYFMGSAHVLKKSIIEKIGFYDEEFGVGAKYPAAEDSNIFFRLKQQDERIVYLPELIFYHPINSVTSELKCFNYSYAVGAMLTKQIFLDSKHSLIYIFIITEIIFKSFLRTLQTVFFLKSIETKNARFRFRSVLMGTLKGVYDYIKNRQ